MKEGVVAARPIIVGKWRPREKDITNIPIRAPNRTERTPSSQLVNPAAEYWSKGEAFLWP